MRTVDEHHHVGVLLDGAGFAQIGELRAALIALGRARELAEDEHGNLQLLGQALQAARNAGHFFLAVAKAPARGDELEIVDDQQGHALVALEAAGFGANFENADRAGVVDPQRRRRNGAQGFGHAPPVFAIQVTGTEFVRVNLRHGCNQALQQGFLGHF